MIPKRLSTFSLLLWLGVLLARDASAQVPPENDVTQTERRYLSGKDKDSRVDWEFFCTANRKSGTWTMIPVPSCWDVEGFGNLAYGDDSDKLPVEQGKYRHTFAVPKEWKTKRINLVFDGVMTDAEVTLNGKTAGPVHQGAFYRFKYDVTDLIKVGAVDNLLEVTVSKRSADASVNRAERKADYWVFGGIFRPVYLEAVPEEHVERVAIDARADGSFAVDVFTGETTTADALEVTILDATGAGVSNARASVKRGVKTPVRLKTTIARPAAWTAETPNLYTARISLKAGEETLHTVSQRFGFRTIEVRPGDGIYVNGTRVMLKGVNHHAAWPDSGRTTSPALDRGDIELIKSMNMNAVRMSHYPPDESFLELCDELGLYVLDELAGWQKSYDTPAATRLVGELIVRDVNHPSILFWDNGNEGGWNKAVDGEFDKWDPQRRHVLHPWETHGGIDTKHYPQYKDLVDRLGRDNVFMPTEFAHGLFDGGAGAGLRDYWDAMRTSKVGAGGFIWVFADEGIRRSEQYGRMDVAGNLAPDGIVGPYREKEGSFYSVRRIWSPVDLPTTLPDDFQGTLSVSNHYDFISLDTLKFTWQLRRWSTINHARAATSVLAAGTAAVPSVEPHRDGALSLGLPADWRQRDADALAVTATDKSGREIETWVWPLKAGGLSAPAAASSQQPINGELRSGNVALTIAPDSGAIRSMTIGGKPFPFTGGPRLVLGVPAKGDASKTTGRLVKATWAAANGGWFRLECEYEAHGACDFVGIGFDFPEKNVTSTTWLGAGPYRVWQNRMEGPTLGVWETIPNNTVTGWSEWQYPEFPGYFADLHWARLATAAGTLTIAPETPGLYFQRYTPRLPPDSLAKTAQAAFPDADLSLLHAIPAIGTKFSAANQTGPQGQPFQAQGIYKIVVWFRAQAP